jgi:2-polyprenyl-3-methyl-5-hydroxy-6-metoxy-1,4-benzoquinol methylase
MTPYQREDLKLIKKAVNYHAYLANKCRPHIENKDVLEVGAGIGAFAKNLTRQQPKSLTLLEPGEETYEELEKSPPEGAIIQKKFSHEHLSTHEGFYDTIIYNNVLEHIEDDIAELKTAQRLLKTGGHIVVFVPSHPYLYSAIDKELLHFRRYTIKGWEKLVSDLSLFENLKTVYINKIGVAGWLLNKYRNATMQSEFMLKVYDKYVLPISSSLDPIFPRCFGLSLYSILRKKSS